MGHLRTWAWLAIPVVVVACGAGDDTDSTTGSNESNTIAGGVSVCVGPQGMTPSNFQGCTGSLKAVSTLASAAGDLPAGLLDGGKALYILASGDASAGMTVWMRHWNHLGWTCAGGGCSCTPSGTRPGVDCTVQGGKQGAFFYHTIPMTPGTYSYEVSLAATGAVSTGELYVGEGEAACRKAKAGSDLNSGWFCADKVENGEKYKRRVMRDTCKVQMLSEVCYWDCAAKTSGKPDICNDACQNPTIASSRPDSFAGDTFTTCHYDTLVTCKKGALLEGATPNSTKSKDYRWTAEDTSWCTYGCNPSGTGMKCCAEGDKGCLAAPLF